MVRFIKRHYDWVIFSINSVLFNKGFHSYIKLCQYGNFALRIPCLFGNFTKLRHCSSNGELIIFSQNDCISIVSLHFSPSLNWLKHLSRHVFRISNSRIIGIYRGTAQVLFYINNSKIIFILLLFVFEHLLTCKTAYRMIFVCWN